MIYGYVLNRMWLYYMWNLLVPSICMSTTIQESNRFQGFQLFVCAIVNKHQTLEPQTFYIINNWSTNNIDGQRVKKACKVELIQVINKIQDKYKRLGSFKYLTCIMLKCFL